MDFYFKIHESEQYAFYSIPKVLYTDQCYKDLSSDAKVLYGVLLDRMYLSKNNGWIDENNKVFIYFSREEARECLGFSNQKIVKLFGELNKFNLIHEVRQGLGQQNKIYIFRIRESGGES